MPNAFLGQTSNIMDTQKIRQKFLNDNCFIFATGTIFNRCS